MCAFRSRRGLTDLNASCCPCRAVGLSQRRRLGSHVQRNEAVIYGAEGRGDGRGGREGGWGEGEGVGRNDARSQVR